MLGKRDFHKEKERVIRFYQDNMRSTRSQASLGLKDPIISALLPVFTRFISTVF